jgi:predicted 2-oxoglutarate/Fe(II)-dependent dioxygenase YbiX
MDTCFYNSSVMNLLDPLSKYSGHAINEEYFKTLRQELWALAEDASGNRLNNLTFSAARWVPGAYADPHSDNSELDGTPNAWQDNKFVTIIYLNDNYDGGDLVFDYHGIKISPSTGTVVAFDPGIINVHSVSKIIAGDRYTMLASWDYASIEYTEEQLEAIRLEKENMKPLQQKQREEWRRSNNAMGD